MKKKPFQLCLPSMNHSKAGFTLIEVIVAILVMTVGVIGSMAMQGISITGNALANRLSHSINQSTIVLEKIINIGYSSTPYNIPLNIDSTGDGTSDLTDTPNISGTRYSSQTAALTALQNEGTAADYTTPLFPPDGGTFTLSINIARDFPDTGMDTIRAIVTNNTGPGNTIGFSTTVTRL